MSEISEDAYRRLKREVDTAKSEAERAKGALGQMMAQLKQEFNCDSLKEAREKLETLEEKKSKAKKAFEKALAEYEKKWKERDES